MSVQSYPYPSPEIQNRSTSGPKIGHVNVSDKKKTLKKKEVIRFSFLLLYLYQIIHNYSAYRYLKQTVNSY